MLKIYQSNRKSRNNKEKDLKIMVGKKNADIQFHPIDIYYNSLLNPLHDELTEDLIVL